MNISNMIFRLLPAVLAVLMQLSLPARAGSLQVAPVSIDVFAPRAASSVTIRNSGKQTMTLQARIFEWKQKKSRDSYYKTRKVVVSPPMLKLRPGQSGIIRIVRLSKTPLQAEESYRLIVDELPRLQKARRSTVTMVIRHSIPVYFSGNNVETKAPTWTIAKKNRHLRVTAINKGDVRVKLSRLTLKDASGNKILSDKGLNGYILGHSKRSFLVKTKNRFSGSHVRLSANSNVGTIQTNIKISK